MYRLFITPKHPVIGYNVSVVAMGTFKEDVSTNGTSFYFVDADHAALVGWGDEGFCNNTMVIQTIDGLSGPTCPTVEGYAFMRRDFLIDEYWPAGNWHVHLDVRNGTTGDDERLFCIEGDIQVNRPNPKSEHTLLRRATEMLLPESFWT